MPRTKKAANADEPTKVKAAIVGVVFLRASDGGLSYSFYTSPTLPHNEMDSFEPRGFGESKAEFLKRALQLFQDKVNESK